MSRARGFTLVELLIVLAIAGLLATIAVPGLLRARRHANETSAIASLRVIADAQQTYATTCASGDYASRLTQLGAAPEEGGVAFISPDLGMADVVEKSGYLINLLRGSDGTAGQLDACNGVPAADLTSSYYATAEPLTSGGTGDNYYWVGVDEAIFGDPSPIVATEGRSPSPGGSPVQRGPGGRAPRRPGDPTPIIVP